MLGVICEHVGLSVARILMFRTQNTTIKIFMFMYMGAWLRAMPGMRRGEHACPRLMLGLTSVVIDT